MSDDSLRLAKLRNNLERRARVFTLTRRFFRERGFLEVATPVRVPAVAPEPYIRPIESQDWYLITSPELHMKRLLAAGYPKIFQITPCFRQGERGRLHNPEFTILEWYRARAGYLEVIRDTEELLIFLAGELGLGTTIVYQYQTINLRPPWQQVSVSEAFQRFAGWDPVANFNQRRFDEDTCFKVLSSLPADRPVVLLDYPKETASLARLKPGQTEIAERAEVFLGGLELANAYSELNDSVEQRRRFLADAAHIEKEQERQAPLPESFLEAVAEMPPAGGIALGMDRLMMLLCDAASIDEVLAFAVDNA
jgi:elongation factor P--(R)-beta-lysine ligase